MYLRPRPTATLRMRERCSNLSGVSGPGNVMGAGAVRSPTVKSRDFYLQRDVTRRELWRKSRRRRAKKKQAQCASPDTKYETVRSKMSHKVVDRAIKE